jgi:hypothetical protein
MLAFKFVHLRLGPVVTAAIVLLLSSSSQSEVPGGDDGRALARDAAMRAFPDARDVVVLGPMRAAEPQYQKVAVTDAAGVDHLLRMSPEGDLLSEDDLNRRILDARAERELLVGTFDDATREIIRRERDKLADRAVRFVVTPRVNLPARPFAPPGLAADEYAKYEVDFADHFELQRELRTAAAERLKNALAAHDVAIEAQTDRAVIVVEDLVNIEWIARLPSVAEVRIDEKEYDTVEQGAASANVATGFDVFREATPIEFDGNGFAGGTNAKIPIGLIEYQKRFKVAPGNMGIVWKSASADACADAADCEQVGLGAICSLNSFECQDVHGTYVASTLGSLDGGSDIGARGARMYYCGAIVNDFDDCASWWNSYSVHIASTSLSSGTSITAYMRDDAVRYDNISVTNYATNDGNDTPPGTTCASPNVICVGNFNHNSGSANKMNATSSWANFSGVDREQPDIAAPGTLLRLYSPYISGWGTISGTSFSTPMVASAIALLHDMSKTQSGPQYYPALEQYPELTKALMMAAATDDVDNQGAVSPPGSNPDERDGAGVST